MPESRACSRWAPTARTAVSTRTSGSPCSIRSCATGARARWSWPAPPTYFSTLANESPLPFLLYNAPGFNGITLSPELVARLAGHDAIVGLKDSASSGIEAFLPLQGPNFAVLAGSANFLLTAMRGGSPGGTVSMANSFPAVALRLYEHGRDDDPAAGDAYGAYVRRVNAAISGRYGVPGVKAAMDLTGYVGGWPRRPLLRLDGNARAELRAALEAEGLL